MAPLLAFLLLAHALAGAGAFPLAAGQRARCHQWAGDGECDEPELCPAGSDPADCSALPLGQPLDNAASRRGLQSGSRAREVR